MTSLLPRERLEEIRDRDANAPERVFDAQYVKRNDIWDAQAYLDRRALLEHVAYIEALLGRCGPAVSYAAEQVSSSHYCKEWRALLKDLEQIK